MARIPESEAHNERNEEEDDGADGSQNLAVYPKVWTNVDGVLFCFVIFRALIKLSEADYLSPLG